MTTTVELLLIALAAGVFLGGAIVGTTVALVSNRTTPVRPWIAVSLGSAWVIAAALATLVIYIGITTTYGVSYN